MFLLFCYFSGGLIFISFFSASNLFLIKYNILIKCNSTNSFCFDSFQQSILIQFNFFSYIFNVLCQVLPRPNSAFTRNTDSKRDCSFQAPTISSYQKQANKKEKVVCYKGLQKQIETTSFIPPHGVPTTLRVTNKMTTAGVIGMLFRKFQVSTYFSWI